MSHINESCRTPGVALEKALGGAEALAALTGSRAYFFPREREKGRKRRERVCMCQGTCSTYWLTMRILFFSFFPHP